MSNFGNVGRDWMLNEVDHMTWQIKEITPADFNEEHRYLPPSISPKRPGPLSYDYMPYMREIVNCADINSEVRECNLMKGVQVGWSTVLESVTLYYIVHVRTAPMMYMSADAELAKGRVENNFVPMINHSGFEYLIKAIDEHNSRKTGKTAKVISWEGGGSLIPFGAKNADKMRDKAILIMLKDEIDGWPNTVGKDGDPDKLSDHRCRGTWEQRKIFRGSTPAESPSKIEYNYKRGDQRKYFVNCKHCGADQYLVFQMERKEMEEGDERPRKYGLVWEMDDGTLDPDSVKYLCKECGGEHYEYDKAWLFDPENGAKWRPTSKPEEPGIRSYHLPAMYSMGTPWYALVSEWLEAWDYERGEARNIGKLQVFYNNTLAIPWIIKGAKISERAVSAHRRRFYRFGEVPNKKAIEYSGSPILFLTCTVDVQKTWLAVGIFGWTTGSRSYLIDYHRFDAASEYDHCEEIGSSVWAKLSEIIEDRVYTADDGREYRIYMTLVDAGYAGDTVVSFCSNYESGVYPILGRDRPGKNAKISEFEIWKTKAGMAGYKITVDNYKDRIAPVLRREWHEDFGTPQRMYHFNAPVDIEDRQLRELTKEERRSKLDDKGNEVFFWHRLGNSRNELWDLLVYGHCSVDIIAYRICIEHFELETVDWKEFWKFMELQLNENAEKD